MARHGEAVRRRREGLHLLAQFLGGPEPPGIVDEGDVAGIDEAQRRQVEGGLDHEFDHEASRRPRSRGRAARPAREPVARPEIGVDPGEARALADGKALDRDAREIGGVATPTGSARRGSARRCRSASRGTGRSARRRRSGPSTGPCRGGGSGRAGRRERRRPRGPGRSARRSSSTARRASGLQRLGAADAVPGIGQRLAHGVRVERRLVGRRHPQGCGHGMGGSVAGGARDRGAAPREGKAEPLDLRRGRGQPRARGGPSAAEGSGGWARARAFSNRPGLTNFGSPATNERR